MPKMSELYPQYYKDASELTEVDVYRICDMFEVGKRDPSGATHHAIKKLLLPGVRTGGKTVQDDVKEARNTLTRRLDMWAEDEAIALRLNATKITDIANPADQLCHPRFEVNLEHEHRQTPAKLMTQLKDYQLPTAETSGIERAAGIVLPMEEWVGTLPRDRMIDFAQRHSLRPYTLRELNPELALTQLYDRLDCHVSLRIK